jgi:hypothetical protein
MADIYSLQIFDGEAVAASGTATSQVYPLSEYKPLGNFGSQISVTGDVDVTATLYISMNAGESYVASSYSLWTAHKQADGESIKQHAMEIGTHFYVVLTGSATGTTSSVDLWLTIN